MYERESYYGGELITISDDEGNSYQLEHVDTMVLDGIYYLAFLPADMDEDDENYGFVLLKKVPGSDEFENLTDEEEDRVYDLFMQRLFNDDEEEDDE